MGEDNELPHDHIDVKPYGKLHSERALFFRTHVGEATNDAGDEYEMSVNMGGMHPIILSKKTGKYFTVNWHDIIGMAVDAGIDEEGELEESDGS